MLLIGQLCFFSGPIFCRKYFEIEVLNFQKREVRVKVKVPNFKTCEVRVKVKVLRIQNSEVRVKVKVLTFQILKVRVKVKVRQNIEKVRSKSKI